MTEATILIVDDDRTIIRLCQRLLERASYQTIAIMDPFDALKILERQKVDLLLSDIRMPIMDGFELISRAKQFQPDLPVLFMTGYGSIDNAIQALHRGVDGLILKPFENSAELLQAVQRVLEESRQKRDAARLQVLRPLFDVTERLLAETSPQTLENLILNAVTGLFQAKFAGIYRINPEIGMVEMVRVTETPLSPVMTPTTAALQQQLIQTAVNGGQPVLACASGPGSGADSGGVEQDALREAGLETVLVAPVHRNNSQFVFCACRAQGSALFTEADLEMFVILARQAAVALENARLYSELKDNVRRVEESQRALIQAEKMAAVGRLMASLAHEINNPLQAVRNCLHLASRRGLDSEQHYQYLQMTDGELERLVATVRRMLDFYRPSGMEKQKTDIRQLVEKVLALLGPQLREQCVEVHLQCVGENVPIMIVPDQIQQVIFNLILNAMDAMEEAASEASRIRKEVPPTLGEAAAAIRARSEVLRNEVLRNAGDAASDAGSPGRPAAEARPDATIWIDIYQESRQVRLLVEDSGPGVPIHLRERVFEPFISTKKHGTGLGLAVSYGIMERHQGSLSLISPRYGNGACFEVVLPLGVEAENGKNTDR